MWRGFCRSDISVSAPFVWRCLSGSTVTPFPHPAHRTGRADFPHPALGQDLTPLFWRATPSAGPEPFLEFIGRPISQVLHHAFRLSLADAPSLHRHYRVSAVLRTSPPPQSARPVPRGFPVGRRSDHALGLPVLRTLSLCTCCRHYPGAASGRIVSLSHPAVSAFPERVVGSACALSFSRPA